MNELDVCENGGLCQNPWIPVSKELPDDLTSVLVAFRNKEVWLGYHEDDRWIYMGDDSGFALHLEPDPDNPITHWMDLPEAPNK